MTTIVVTGLDAVQAALKKLSRIEARPIQNLIGLTIQQQTEDRFFKTKTDPNGLRWAPWSRRYAETRGPEHSLLIDTGSLSESFSKINSGNAVVMGTDVSYAPENDLERPFMGLSEDNKRELRDVIEDWLREQLK